MIPARSSQRLGGETKLLVMNGMEKIKHTTVHRLVDHLNENDLLIVNTSGTLPASFQGQLERTGEEIEIRLAAFQGSHPTHLQNWWAFSFGKGDWRTVTEQRGLPPRLVAGDKIIFGSDLTLEVVSCEHERLLDVKFLSDQIERNLYRYGKPIQYAYLSENIRVWDQQTIFSGTPISVEPPSASFPFTWELMLALRKKGVIISGVLHGAGLSSTGSVKLDRLLPLTEWYDIPASTALKYKRAQQSGNKIIVLGTTVLRAIESAWDGKALKTGHGLTDLKITPHYRIQAVNGLITGMHDVGTSHRGILNSICPDSQIQAGYSEAEERGYRTHEYGDLAFLEGKR